MKTPRLLASCLSLSILVGLSLSCEQKISELAQPSTGAGTEKITNLLNRALQEGTQAEYDAISADYKALTFDELELFNQVKTAIDNKRVVRKMTDAGVQLTQQQRQTLTNALEQANALRSAVNKQAVALYGMSYNKLADSVLNNLVDQEAQNFAIDMPNYNPEPTGNARAAQVTGCTSASFPYVATKLSGNLKWNYWGQKSTPNHPNDCDYEFRYSGYLFRFYPKDWFAEKLCNSFNNRLSRRSNDTYTRMLFGNRGVWLWIGWPGLTSVEMRSV